MHVSDLRHTRGGVLTAMMLSKGRALQNAKSKHAILHFAGSEAQGKVRTYKNWVKVGQAVRRRGLEVASVGNFAVDEHCDPHL